MIPSIWVRSVSRLYKFGWSSIPFTFAFGSLPCFDSELVSPRLLKGSREGFCPAVFALLPSDLRPEGRDIDPVSVRDLLGLGPGC